MQMTPTTRQKLLFWLLLAAASSFFAEVISGSELFPFSTPNGLLLVVPLYGLHILLLSGMVYSKGIPRFHTLFFAGMLFGLYEAYITKVLWNPFWEGPFFHILEIEIPAATTLVLWWHPFMSFIVPLMLVEIFATSSSTVFESLPGRLRGWLGSPRIQVGLAMAAGLLQTAGKPPLLSFIAGIVGLLVLWLLLAWWRRTNRNKLPLTQLLPANRQLRWVLAFLILLYLLTGFNIRPEALPGVTGHVVILAIYILTGLLLWRGLRQSSAKEPAASAIDLPARRVFTLVSVYLLATLLSSFFPDNIKLIIFVAETIFGWIFGISIFIYCLRQVFKRS